MSGWRLCLCAIVICVLGLSSIVLASGTATQLIVPLGRLGHAGTAGPTALWRGQGAAFLIQTSGSLDSATGNVQRSDIEVALDGTIRIAQAPAWRAAALLDSAGHRNIYTSDQSGATLPFEWANLGPGLQVALDGADGLGQLRTAFLRGDRTHETSQPQGQFRTRTSLLGDIENSVPLIVGSPSASITEPGHAAFRAQAAQRPITVFVGANDGMLHAFSAATGVELFAYIPSALGAQLASLSSPAFKAAPFVDGSPGQGDARIGGVWRTVLACGMGMGSRGLFALDTSDPAHFDQGMGALWEFTEADDPAIGHVRDAPLITAIKRGRGDGQSTRRPVAIVSSGINPLSADGAGALFLLALDKPAAQVWKRGVNYFSIATAGAHSPANALSAPALVIQGDGSASRAYAGDLLGNLWRFDFASMTAHRLFTAQAEDGSLQPIAYAPKVVFAPGGGYLILFATGKLIEASDLLPSSFTPQSVYAILDAPADADSVVLRSQLARRSLAPGATGYVISGRSFPFTGPGARRGWYFDFLNTRNDGERAAGSPVSAASAIVLASFLPALSPDAAATSRVYLLDALTGLAYEPATVSQPNPVTGMASPANLASALMLVGGATASGERNGTGAAATTRRMAVVNPDTGLVQPVTNFEVRYPSARLGWREVANWRELHQAAIRKQR